MLALSLGCGEAQPALPERYATQGKLLYNGQPPKGAVVTLWKTPVSQGDWMKNKPTGQVGEDGSFQLWTFTPEDGAMEGEYAVTLVWDRTADGPGGNDAFAGRYSNPQKPIKTVHIKAEQENVLAPIDLKGPPTTGPSRGG